MLKNVLFRSIMVLLTQLGVIIMAVSQDFAKRKQKRLQERRRKQKRTILVGVCLLLIIIISIASVKSNSKKNIPTEPFSADSLILMPEPKQKNADILATIPNNNGIKTAYLTFDDGPTTSVTPGILDILRRYDIKATFFMVGSLIESNPAIAYRVYSEGHTLANHSYQHNYSYLYESEENFMSELNKTYSLITSITDNENYPKIFRFPGGGYNSGSYGEKKQLYKQVLQSQGYRYADWNALNGDSETTKPQADVLIERIKKSSKNKEDIVILMHDAAAKKVNLQALPATLDYLLSQGYVFDTLDNAL